MGIVKNLKFYLYGDIFVKFEKERLVILQLWVTGQHYHIAPLQMTLLESRVICLMSDRK